MRALSTATLCTAALLTAACGGDDPADGDGDGEPDVPALAYCDPVADWSPAAAAEEVAVLELVNGHRLAGATCGGEAKPPVPALTMDPALRCAARVHSLDMVTRGYFDHTNLEGEAPWDRMDHAGYGWSTAGENIAAGNVTAAATMDQWMNSPGHCANIMNDGYVHLGVGYAESGAMWTQVFGAP